MNLRSKQVSNLSIFNIFKNDFILEQFFSSQQNRVVTFHIPSAHSPASPIIKILYQSGTFVINDGHILIHHHPKFIIYIRLHSWCCEYCEFWQMYNDMYPLLQGHTESFHCPKNLCTAYSSPSLHPPWSPGSHWSFYYLHSFAFSRMSHSWNHSVCSLFRLTSFTWKHTFKFPPCLFIV